MISRTFFPKKRKRGGGGVYVREGIVSLVFKTGRMAGSSGEKLEEGLIWEVRSEGRPRTRRTASGGCSTPFFRAEGIFSLDGFAPLQDACRFWAEENTPAIVKKGVEAFVCLCIFLSSGGSRALVREEKNIFFHVRKAGYRCVRVDPAPREKEGGLARNRRQETRREGGRERSTTFRVILRRLERKAVGSEGYLFIG